MNEPQTPGRKSSPLLGYAMRFGMILGLVMSMQILLSLMFPGSLFAQLFSWVLLVFTPILMIRLGIVVRKQAYGNMMLYGRALWYLMLQLIFALIPFTLAAYVGFSRLLGTPEGQEMMQKSIEMWSQVAGDDPSIQRGIDMIRQLSVWDMTWQFVMSVAMFGMLFNYIAAFFVRRGVPTRQI